MAAACGVRTARDAAAAAASAAPGLGLGRTPRKSEGRGFDDEEAPLLEKVLATREERVSDGEADTDLLGGGDGDANAEGNGEGSAAGAGAWTRDSVWLLVLGMTLASSESESESEEEMRRSRSSTARRWSASATSASEDAEEVGEDGRKASRSSSRSGGACCDAIAGDDDAGIGVGAFASKVLCCVRFCELFAQCVSSFTDDCITADTYWAEAHSISP